MANRFSPRRFHTNPTARPRRFHTNLTALPNGPGQVARHRFEMWSRKKVEAGTAVRADRGEDRPWGKIGHPGGKSSISRLGRMPMARYMLGYIAAAYGYPANCWRERRTSGKPHLSPWPPMAFARGLALYPTRNAVYFAWLKVSQHMAQEALRKSEVTSTNTSNPSRRHKGWVPTSRDPVPSDWPASQITTPSTRAPAPPPPRAAPTSPAPTAPTVALGPNEAAPLGHPDHPLGPLTELELADVSRYPNAPLEVQRNVLQTFRTMHHMDRFSRPGWE